MLRSAVAPSADRNVIRQAAGESTLTTAKSETGKECGHEQEDYDGAQEDE